MRHPSQMDEYNHFLWKTLQGKSFTRTLFELMVPIAIMQIFNAGLALVDNMFIGQLGEVSVTAVSLAYQIYFILSIIYFGINSGSAIFTAQYWGGQDIQSIRKVVAVNVIINTTVGIVFTAVAELFPEKLISIYTNDPAVIALGAGYLRIYAIGYLMVGISQGFYGILRSTERVRIPMFINSIALIINTLLGYLLIFGNFNFPKMGALGAATANVTARSIEIIVLITILFTTNSILIRDLLKVFPIHKDFLLRFYRTTAPVVLNEILWSVGISAYSFIYAHISTEAMAAANIATNIENLAFVPLIAISSACAVMLGNRIGANEVELAIKYSKKILIIEIASGLVTGLIMFLTKDFLVGIYKIEPSTQSAAKIILTLLSILLVVKSVNMIMFIGILRAGGDTRFALLLEICTLWIYGFPAAWIGANLFHLPVQWVVAIVLSEEFLKSIIVLFRYRSKKWIHHLTKPEPALPDLSS